MKIIVNIFLLILLIVLSFHTKAKVAYLPITAPSVDLTTESFLRDTIIVLDLDTNSVIKHIKWPNGNFNGSVFLNSAGTKLYAAGLTQVITIDTTTLEIENIMEVPVEVNVGVDIPAKIDQIFLNPQGDKLFYTSVLSGLLHQINLSTNEITTPIQFVDEIITDVQFNDNLNTLVISSEPVGVSNSTFHVYDLNTLINIFNNPATTDYIQLISNDGYDYYYNSNFERAITSRKLSDNSLNWTFELEGERYFSIVLENDDNTLTVVGRLNTYKVNKTTGEWFIDSQFNISDFDLLSRGSLKRVDSNSFFSASSLLVVCAATTPPGCTLAPGMTASVSNFTNGTSQLVFQSDIFGGSEVRGNFIGNRFAVPVSVPVMVNKLLLILLLTLIILITYMARHSKLSLINVK